MIIRRLLAALFFAATLAAQTFIQMSDPQFGMFSKNQNFEHETVNYEFAIATANRLKPALVVITGDLINEAGNTAQAAEYKRITAKIVVTGPVGLPLRGAKSGMRFVTVTESGITHNYLELSEIPESGSRQVSDCHLRASAR